ncbi:hypothetical protein [Amycolatopsis nigrescens]|uniref:hypothetical protein n=1 Tax=Amycolatopsis nigrescens TaxID=381445 RepID=UPI000380BD66|nr:hypothetical protein [Amycolatopsis nigrescens]
MQDGSWDWRIQALLGKLGEHSHRLRSIKPTPEGLFVGIAEEYIIEVKVDGFEYRLTATSRLDPAGSSRSWRYGGQSTESLAAAVRAALDWNGAWDTEPAGWTFNHQTGETRRQDYYTPEYA